jgi:hypothetical protein
MDEHRVAAWRHDDADKDENGSRRPLRHARPYQCTQSFARFRAVFRLTAYAHSPVASRGAHVLFEIEPPSHKTTAQSFGTLHAVAGLAHSAYEYPLTSPRIGARLFLRFAMNKRSALCRPTTSIPGNTGIA